MKKIILLFLFFLLTFTPLAIHAHSDDNDTGYHHMMDFITEGGNDSMMMGNFGIFGWIFWIFMIILWALIIIAIVLFIIWFAKQMSGKTSKDKEKSAQDILKERYAKGEINKEEFENKKKDLTS